MTTVAFYREEDGSCPFMDWFDELRTKVQDNSYLRLERLPERGHESRDPKRISCAMANQELALLAIANIRGCA